MTELPTVRAVVLQAAQRRARRRRTRRVASLGAGVAVAAVAAVVATGSWVTADREVPAASPTETSVPIGAPTPPTSRAGTRVAAIELDAKGAARTATARTALAPGGTLIGAWSLGRIHGTVYLIRRPPEPAVAPQGSWCLSVPDPGSRHPDRQRAESCVDPEAFKRGGIEIWARGIFASVSSHSDHELAVRLQER